MAAAVAYIGLGANLGNSEATLEAACQALAALPQCRLLRRSSIYRTAPVDASGPDYLNAVVELSTELEAPKLLAQLQRIELLHGRKRPYQHAPRTLDLDLLLFGDEAIHTPELAVPHPRMHNRAFVLRPLAELAPHLKIPGHGTVAHCLAGVAGQRADRLSP